MWATRALLWLFGAGAVLALHGCELVRNYDDPDGPRYAENYSTSPALLADEFTLASFNIEFADEVELAIQEIGQSPELNAAAVVLLQEMDADGTDAVARELGYNYVYYPGSVNHGQDFGNAVLSRWPIVADEKLILPHRNPTNGRIRIAVSATLDTPSGSVVAFSVHTETPWLGPRARLDQARAIVADAEQFTEPVVIGGDFNTLEGRSVDETGQVFEQAGYAWATKPLGPSTASPIGDLRLDHVFVKRLVGLAASTEPTAASDHEPLWVNLQRTAPQ